jgi:glycosyltransferase involved in cell wall biosynthesis
MSHGRAVAAGPAPLGAGDAAAETPTKHVVISSFDSPSNPHYNGGGAAVIAMMATRLARHYEVTVLTAGQRSGTSVHDGVCYRRLPIGWAGPRGGQLLYHAILPFAARRIPHDIWIESFTPPFSTSFVPIFSRKRVVGFAQGLSGKDMWGRYRIPFFLIERFGLRFYRDMVVLNSADYTLVRRYNPSATVRVIPNGIDLPFVDEAQIGRGEHILFLGRIDIWVKGLDLLLEGYRKSGVDMPLLIAGSGTPRDERWLADQIAANKGDVHWVGRVTGQHKQDLLERSSFVVMPSRRETFGLTALEAMSFGKPVVHFDLPPLRWIEGDTRVPSFDIDMFAHEIRYLAGDEAARRVLGRRGHAAAQRYSNDAAADRYLALVEELLGTASVGPEAAVGRSC